MARILAKGTLGIPMPPIRTGEIDRKLQGGLPPEPYRNRNNWMGASGRAREPWASKSAMLETFHTTSEWDQSANGGRGKWVAP